MKIGVVDKNVDQLIDWYLASKLIHLLPLHWMEDGECSCRDIGCMSKGKHPLTKNGKDDATWSRVTIKRWRERWPRCNWGARPPIGVVIVDVDPRHDGDVRLAELQRDYGQLPSTRTAITGGAGLHMWFKLDGPSRGKLTKGIDIKTHSGYVVMPPSNHESGDNYEWLDTRPIEAAPEWVRRMLLPRPVDREYVPSGEGGVELLVAWLLEQQPGNRNHATYWACCEARDSGYDPNRLVEAAVAIGLSQAEAEATARSAFRGK